MALEPAVQAMIDRWWKVMGEIVVFEPQLKPLVEEERILRKAIVGAIWPADKPENEGTKYLELGGGWRLKGVVKIDRKVDEAAWPAIKERLKQLQVMDDDIVVMEPKLNLKKFRELTAEIQQVVCEALDVKPASPTLEAVPPKPPTGA